MDEPDNLYEVIGCIYSIYKRDSFSWIELVEQIPGYNKTIHMKLITREYFKRTDGVVKDFNSKNKWFKYKLTMKAIITNKRWGKWKMYY